MYAIGLGSVQGGLRVLAFRVLKLTPLNLLGFGFRV